VARGVRPPAAVGRRSATLGISAGVALSAYLADSFIPLIKHLGRLRDISPTTGSSAATRSETA